MKSKSKGSNTKNAVTILVIIAFIILICIFVVPLLIATVQFNPNQTAADTLTASQLNSILPGNFSGQLPKVYYYSKAANINNAEETFYSGDFPSSHVSVTVLYLLFRNYSAANSYYVANLNGQ
ncbi:MAG: hypothetical protein KGH72_04195, partial [Candidatus Micrarchaeota archaeon]|nr:hypothetical protein [Candidatus Micrarchaeota archaeon]